MSASKSLILITVDCLRADHTGFMGYTRPTTPFLDGLALEGTVFPKAIVAGAPTYYSLPGIMASRYPLALGREVIGLAPGEPVLAKVLQQEGYRTAAFVAGNPYLTGRFGYDQGFDVFQDFLSSELTEVEKQGADDPSARLRTRLNDRLADAAHRAGALGRLYDELYFQYRLRIAAPKATWDSLRRFPSADVLVDGATAWLESSGRGPFFLWLHFMDPHAPYYPVAEALSQMEVHAKILPGRGRFLNAAWTEFGASRIHKYRNDIMQLYDAGIRWVDKQIARLVDRLRALSLWDFSVLALTADHGEEFLDHGGRFHYSSRAYQELLHVPLLVRAPGTHAKVLADRPFSHIDLAPTLLDALGVEAPPEFVGRSWWSEPGRRESEDGVVSESVGNCSNPMDAAKRLHGRVLAVQDRRYKLVLDFDRKSEQFFDLVRDPRELQGLAEGTEKANRARLLKAAARHLARTAGSAEREWALRARVRELGLEWKHSDMNSKTLAF